MGGSRAEPRITYGGWFPRTTIHLREIYSFLLDGTSKLSLDKSKLSQLRQELGLREVTRQAGKLEFVSALTENDIEIRYYEDGLFTLALYSSDLKASKETLERYYESKFEPAISYIFSLGAPTPKILASIKALHPIVISFAHGKSATLDEQDLGQHVYERVSAHDITVDKTANFFLVSGKNTDDQTLRELVEMQIFFREFKDQLERYLNIHRTIWEEIERIKEQQYLRGDEIEAVRAHLDDYQKTVNLISNRINQMGAYVETRKSIAKEVKIEDILVALFQYKFDVLLNTLEYITEIWEMTSNYLSSAIQVINEARSQANTSSIDSLRSVTTLGVVSGILGYLASSELPSVTAVGVKYLILLLLLTLLVIGIISFVSRRRRYRIQINDVVIRN